MNKKLICTLLPIALIIGACTESAPLSDENRDLLNAYGEIVSDTLYAEADTFLVEGKVNTGRSPKLSLGSYADFESRVLLKFSILPPDTMVFDSLRLILSAPGDFGEFSGNLTGNAYRVTSEWSESVNTDEAWDYRSNIDYSPETTASFSLPDMDTTVYTDFDIDLPVSLMGFWQDTVGGDNNHGLLLDFTSTGFIREFSSREGPFPTRRPRIVYVYHAAGTDSTIRDTILASQDAALIDFKGSFNTDNLYVTSGYAARSFFKFNFDSIPPTANMTSVRFFYTRDSLNSVLNSRRDHHIFMRNVTTDFNKLPEFEIDSTFMLSSRHTVVLYDRDDGLILDDRFRANVAQYFIQDFINEFVDHGSFFLQYTNEGNDVSVYAIQGVDAQDKARRPHLILEYYINPRGRL